MTLTLSQLAKKAHSTPEAVSMARKRGKLPQGAMFDDSDPVVVAWLEGVESRRSVRAAGKAPETSSISSAPISSTTSAASSAPSGVSLDRSRKIADLNLKRAQGQGHELRNAEKKGQVILRELVVRKFAAFDASLKTNFRDLPRRVAPQLFALAQTEGERAMQIYLETQISAAIERSKIEAMKLGLS